MKKRKKIQKKKKRIRSNVFCWSVHAFWLQNFCPSLVFFFRFKFCFSFILPLFMNFFFIFKVPSVLTQSFSLFSFFLLVMSVRYRLYHFCFIDSNWVDVTLHYKCKILFLLYLAIRLSYQKCDIIVIIVIKIIL